MSWQRAVENELAKPTHTNTAFCSLCDEKLKDVDPELIQMVSYLRSKDSSIHVSWGWRGEADQNRFFAERKSDVKYPHSKHNRMLNGKPCSAAVDLFTIDQDGNARFVVHQFSRIWGMVTGKFSVDWGGNWKKWKDGKLVASPDYPHFELSKSVS